MRRVRQQQRLPAHLDLRQQQPVLVGRRFDVSRPARVARAANARLGPVPRVVHAGEGHEQRRRVLLQLANRSDRHLEGLGPRRQRSTAQAGRQRVGAEGRLADRRHGEAYSAPPFNITSGVTTVQGTAGRPIVDGEFIPRNSGEGSTFFSLNARVSYTFHFADRWQFEVLGEGFNLTDHVNVVTRNTNFGAGAYPTNPSPTYNQITAVGDPRSFQFGPRLRF